MPAAPKQRMTWKKFKAKWQNCSACNLHEQRRNIVLGRGKVPCDVLFVGEAPGASEDAIGWSFVGPAGHELDLEIKQALENVDAESLRICFCNIICCMPKLHGGGKNTAPPKEAIKACRPRLLEFIKLCNPKLIVKVGDYAEKNVPEYEDILAVSIVHPGAILRAELVRKPLMIKTNVVTLTYAFQEVLSPF